MTIKLGIGFKGIAANQVDGNPPNCALAVGSRSLVVSTIWRVQLRSKASGAVVDARSGRDFFQAAGDHADARALYNNFTGKMLVSGMVPGNNGKPTCVAMTADDSDNLTLDPVKWVKHQFNYGSDFPVWGYNRDGFICAFGSAEQPNMYIRLFPNGVWNLVQTSQELLWGSAPVVAKMPDSNVNDPMWLVRQDDFNKLRLFKFEVNPLFPAFAAFDVPTRQTFSANRARQPNGESFFQGPPNGDCMIRNLGGKTLMFYLAGCGNQHRSCDLYWAIIDLSSGTPVMVQDGLEGSGADNDFFNGSLAVNRAGVRLHNFSSSGKAAWIANTASASKKTDVAEETSYQTLVRSTEPIHGPRVGDYSCTAVDHADDSFWTMNQWVDNGSASPNYNWATWIQNLSVVPNGPEIRDVRLNGTITMTLNGQPVSIPFTGVGNAN